MQNNKILATQDNSLIDACYSLSLNEKKLFLLGVSKLNGLDFLSSTERENKEIELTISDWEEAFGKDSNTYLNMASAAKNILTRTVKVHVRHGHVREFVLVQEVNYFEGEGRLTLKFSSSAMVRLVGLYQEFTKLNLLDVANFSSPYSIRLYELVKQFDSTGYRQMAVEDFRFAMDCVRSYPAIAELKRRVLFPALKEINEKSPIKINFSEKKKGRKITDFVFVIAQEPKTHPKTPKNAHSSDFFGEGMVIDG